MKRLTLFLVAVALVAVACFERDEIPVAGVDKAGIIQRPVVAWTTRHHSSAPVTIHHRLRAYVLTGSYTDPTYTDLGYDDDDWMPVTTSKASVGDRIALVWTLTNPWHISSSSTYWKHAAIDEAHLELVTDDSQTEDLSIGPPFDYHPTLIGRDVLDTHYNLVISFPNGATDCDSLAYDYGNNERRVRFGLEVNDTARCTPTDSASGEAFVGENLSDCPDGNCVHEVEMIEKRYKILPAAATPQYVIYAISCLDETQPDSTCAYIGSSCDDAKFPMINNCRFIHEDSTSQVQCWYDDDDSCDRRGSGYLDNNMTWEPGIKVLVNASGGGGGGDPELKVRPTPGKRPDEVPEVKGIE